MIIHPQTFSEQQFLNKILFSYRLFSFLYTTIIEEIYTQKIIKRDLSVSIQSIRYGMEVDVQTQALTS